MPRTLIGLYSCLILFACDRVVDDPTRETKVASRKAANAAAVSGPQTGLDFPSNGQTQTDIRFRFTGGNLLPMYPATYVWRINPRQQAGYYTTFYWGPGTYFHWNSYYGPNPYPDGDNKPYSTSHKWAIGAYGNNFTTDANGNSTQLGYGAWKTQSLRVYQSGNQKVHEFYWDLPDTTKVIRTLLYSGYGNPPPSDAALTFGDAPWSLKVQRLSGILRGLQLYNTNLSTADLLAELKAPLSTASGSANVWYLNLNPTPTDISDKSGKNHNPAWVGAGRAALWSDGTGGTTPSVELSANPATVASGGKSTLTWSSADAASCDASGAWSGSKALNGSEQTAALTATGTYTLTCTGTGGTAGQSATITVTSTPLPAPTLTLTANPATVNGGTASTLSWSSANATSCNASGAWSGSKALNGSEQTAALTATTTYTLACAGSGGSISKSATITVNQDPGGGGQTGLDFPSNGPVANDVRFRFTGGNLIPMYPATYIWRVNLRQQTGYYTTFFWGPDGAFTGTSYYGAHPYPDGDNKPYSTSHKWEISIDGQDFVTDANGHSTQLGYNVWRTQAFRVYDNGTHKVHDFYWDLPDTTKVIRTLVRGYGLPTPSSPALTFGTAPWAPANEHLSGVLRGIQLYSTNLSNADLLSEVNAPLSTSAGGSSVWYMNINPTPGDISDKSGKGHHPAWVTSLRPSLWTGP